jgi:magnesium transporter
MTARVLQTFQGQLQAVASLVVFMPLIISTGGNAGSQSATLVIRALATDQIRPTDWLAVVLKEALVGLALGAVVGMLGMFGGLFFSVHLAITVALSVLAVVTVGALLGAVMPLLIQRVGLDPAVSSTPFIASLSDVVGLLIYLTVAGVVMRAH